MFGSNPSAQLRSARLAILKRQWQPVVENIVAACSGDAVAADRVSPLLDRLSSHDDWRDLTEVLGRILSGEREPGSLLEGLDPTDTLIAGNVLKNLGVDTSTVVPGLILLESLPEAGDQLGDLTLVDFIGTAIEACRSDAPIEESDRITALTTALAADAEAPEELRALAAALAALLTGEVPDLGRLSPSIRSLLTGSAASLLRRSPEPIQA